MPWCLPPLPCLLFRVLRGPLLFSLVSGGLLLPSVPLRTPLHAVTVRIHLRRIYTVCSLYLAPGVPIARDDFVELLHQLTEPFLLVGDFNIRHPSWGDTVSSPNAAMLLSVTSDFPFAV